MRQKASNVHWV